MVHFVVSVLLLWSERNSTASGSCTITFDRFSRPANPGYIVARATKDSVADGQYFFSSKGLTRKPNPAQRKGFMVYAQVLELIDAQGPGSQVLQDHRRIALVWWQLDDACFRWVPRSALGLESGEVFALKQPRDPNDWIDGLPTYDIEVGDWTYAPAREPWSAQVNGAVRAMTLGEYLTLFPLLPTEQEWHWPSDQAALQRLIAWGNEEPERWTVYPARIALCHAQRLLTGTDCPAGQRR